MGIFGRVQNGVVVFDGPQTFPEGTEVIVTTRSSPAIQISKNQKPVEFPLIHSSEPGSLQLTNEMIGQIFDDEDIEAMKKTWENTP